jgi:HEAT repeat protein
MAALIHNATEHAEPVVREACAAALGSLGDIRGLPAIIAACSDKPAVRRRAVLALAPFEGDEVEAVLTRALEDTDWQVRQNAEILVNPRE